MSYSICRIKNITEEEHVRKGVTFSAGYVHTIPDYERVAWATDDNVGDDIQNDILQVYDANGAIDTHMAQIAHLQGY